MQHQSFSFPHQDHLEIVSRNFPPTLRAFLSSMTIIGLALLQQHHHNRKLLLNSLDPAPPETTGIDDVACSALIPQLERT